MHAAITFLRDVCILLYLIVKSLFLPFIPKHIFYKELKEEVVLITGGCNGIGHLLAIKLSRLGCSVVIWDIDKKGGENTVKLIRDNGGKGYFYLCDVADREDVYSKAVKVKEEVGPVTVLINNAAVVTIKPLTECPDRLIERTFRVNTLAHFWTCKAFLPDMTANNHGHIINIASLAGFAGVPGLSSYCASKAALVVFHECLSIELAKSKLDGIKTSLVCQWHTDTTMFNSVKIRIGGPLRTSDVADRIITGIRSNEDVVIIPWIFKPLLVLKSMVPSSVLIKLFEICGAFDYLNKRSE